MRLQYVAVVLVIGGCLGLSYSPADGDQQDHQPALDPARRSLR